MGILREEYRYCEACTDPVNSDFLKARAIKITPMVRDNDHGYWTEENDRLVFCWAGSDDFMDWVSNISFLALREGNTIHFGFYDSWKKFKDEVSVVAGDYAARWTARGLKPSLFFTGHSRGSPLTILAARHCAKNLGLACRGVVFGAPLIGTQAYKDEFEILPLDFTRVENGWDIVTQVPPEKFGFRKEGKIVKIKQPWWHQHPLLTATDHVGYPKALERAGM
jgi:hypothetical protein